MHLLNTQHVLGCCYTARDSCLPIPPEAVTWSQWCYPVNPWDRTCICSSARNWSEAVPSSCKHLPQTLACLCPKGTSCTSFSYPPQQVPISPLPAQNTSLSFYPFPPTTEASKLCCKGGEGQKGGGREITTTAASSCPHPLPLCSVPKCAHREQQLIQDPITPSTPAAPCAGADAAWDFCSAACRAVAMGKHSSKGRSIPWHVEPQWMTPTRSCQKF